MKPFRIELRTWFTALALCLGLVSPGLSHAQLAPGKMDPDGYDMTKLRAALPEYFHPMGNDRTRPTDLPDVFGPGATLRVGNVHMKVTDRKSVV